MNTRRCLVRGAIALGSSLILGLCSPTLAQPSPQQFQELANQIDQLREQGNMQAAIPLAERFVTLVENTLGSNHPLLAASLNELAKLHVEQGNYAAALPLYQRALTIYERAGGSDQPEVSATLNNLANLYRAQGNYDAALPVFQRALAIAEKTLGFNHPEVAVILNNIGLLYTEQKKRAAALPLYQRALRIFEQTLGEKSPYVATTLNNLAALYREQKNYADALPLYQRALQIREQTLPAGHPDIAASLNNLATLYFDQRNYAAALPLYQRALAIAQSRLGESHPHTAAALGNLAAVYWQQGNLTQTLALLQNVQEIEEKNLSQNLIVGSEDYKRNYLGTFQNSTDAILTLHLQNLPQDPEATALALTTLLRRKGRLLDFLSQNQARLRRQLAAPDQAKLQQLTTLRTTIAKLVFASAKPAAFSQVQQLQAQANQLEAELSLRSASFRELTQPVTIAAVQRAIPANAALIEFIRYRPYDLGKQSFGELRYGVYVLRATGQPLGRDLGTAAEIDTQVRQTRLRLADPRLPKGEVQRAAQVLAERVMTPIRPWIGNATHLLIAPDGELNTIPFQALVDAQGRYLVESYLITLLTSGRELLRLQSQSESTAVPLIVADPSFDHSFGNAAASPAVRSLDLRGLAFAPLPGTAQEAQALRALLPQARLLVQGAATEAALKAAKSPKILHLATHGFFLAPSGNRDILENPLLRSGLALAGFNQRQSGSDVDDGVLTALEVTGMNLSGTELVVLSACDTGRGDVVNGEGVYGLRRAFTLAGARSQVSTLWKVDDQVTRDIMVAFYQNLRRGMGRTEALRQVQLQRLKDESPYYWAAFVSSGDWSPLALPR
ncbi:CHAT domain-containing protein [Thermosynechococcus sp. JY1334]|uniref:CHAT domain-containing tetratricopeptide repeat protein n=1 Tax=unclassified Thermosynechococcus TaxID=2622553 RepID=UPI0026713C2F|nr:MULTISPECIES: CHAT domain-containing protein [unclassified Thermosynechococcus]MDR7897681.1 CHAT domain-containing protein [Thermosynechococcus sp. JY1332]MDR7905079.1 CHAT domain-containing protein [Thermosynechococcus sp. JY1334]WKT87301.1 CHAT domain-containing protein [Thermosynechococcus sp. JY1339]WNC56243.1 CHAT domain-containing protein [Thermosynechococcus sp. JY1331]